MTDYDDAAVGMQPGYRHLAAAGRAPEKKLGVLSISPPLVRQIDEGRPRAFERAGFEATNGLKKGDKKIMETKTKPTYEQAQLHLQLFEMRREDRLRQARDWFFKNYFANTMAESMQIAAPGTEPGTYVMMVFGYWDQACAFLNYGLLHEDLFFETSGEFFAVWERVRSIIPEGRKMFVNPQFLAHLEKAANRYETWIEARSPGHLAAMREFMKQMRVQPGKAA